MNPVLDPTLQLAHPWALVLLLAVPLGAAALWLERRRAPRLRHPRAALLARAERGWAARLWWLPQALVLAALALVALGLARPRTLERRAAAGAVEGIDIVIALDLSSSMRAADFQPQDRLHVAREVLKDFVGRRKNDRIGLVVFAAEAYSRCPLTLDHAILRGIVDQLRTASWSRARLSTGASEPALEGMEDGTAIGNALATAVNRLRGSAARSKALILITDGENNAGQLSPLEAAQLARAFGVRVFPILVGKGGLVPYPEDDLFGTMRLREYPVNPELLRRIARITGGTYASATDRASLEHGLQGVLDRMEKTRLFEAGGGSRERERFPELLGPAFWLGALGLFLAATRWRAFP